MSEIEDIRSMPMVDLRDEETALRKEIFNLRMKMQTDATVWTDYKKTKKRLAQVLTIQNEKLKVEQAA